MRNSNVRSYDRAIVDAVSLNLGVLIIIAPAREDALNLVWRCSHYAIKVGACDVTGFLRKCHALWCFFSETL